MGVPKGAVWKCVDGAFSFVPGLAYTSVYRSCTPDLFGAPAQELSQMNFRLIEFTTDDGERVRADW